MKSFLTVSSFLTVLLAQLLFLQPVSAQRELLDQTAKNAFGENVTQQTLPTNIGTIIRQFLTLIGVVVVVIIIYAGVTWLTAGGDVEKVKKAKAWLANSIMGLIIIFGAYAISEFVIESIINSTS